jgi:CheY-specific phosphatase CheX
MTTDTQTPAALAHGECVPQAVINILNTVCQADAQQDPALDQTVVNSGAMLVVISLVGDVSWSVFLGIPRETAVQLAAKFAGFEIPFDSADMGDAVGELGNMFGGDVKAKLDAMGVRAEISLPSVTRGEALHMLFPNESPVEQYTFTTTSGKLLAGVSAKRAIH